MPSFFLTTNFNTFFRFGLYTTEMHVHRKQRIFGMRFLLFLVTLLNSLCWVPNFSHASVVLAGDVFFNNLSVLQVPFVRLSIKLISPSIPMDMTSIWKFGVSSTVWLYFSANLVGLLCLFLLVVLIATLIRVYQKHSELIELHKSQEERVRLFLEVIELTDECIEIVDENHRYIEVNPAFERYLGYSEEEVIGKTPKELLRSDAHPPEFWEEINQSLDEGKCWRGEIFSTTKHGDVRCFDMTVTPVRDDTGKITHFLSIRRDMTKHIALKKQLELDALYDNLTGLPNRKLFAQRLEKALAGYQRDSSKNFAVMFLDLDRFKKVNDSLGHLVGDLLLVEAAERLRGCLRNTDTVARFGGDEFAILLELSGAPRKPVMVAQRIQDELCRPFSIEGNDMSVSTSIGITFSSPDYTLPEELLRDADTAMYRAKDSGRARHAIFDQQMHEEVAQLLKTEDELRQALEQSQFEVYYQPVIDLKSSRPLGIEALVRWRHPSGEVRTPGDFLPVLEDMGLITRLDAISLEIACSQFNNLRNNIQLPSTFRLHFNLSPHQFTEVDLAKKFVDTVNIHQLTPDLLKLEISEAAISQDFELVHNCIKGLKNAGFRIVMDNFGAGSSSMIHLQRLNVDELKLDHSFVHGLMEDETKPPIVRTIFQLSSMLKMTVVAEGVESQLQENQLLSLGCLYAQGYLYARPMNIEQIEKYLESWFKPQD